MRTSMKLVILTKNMENYNSKSTSESTPLNKLAVRRRLGQNACWRSEYDPCLNEAL